MLLGDSQSYSQVLGTPRIPEDLLRTTILIEVARKRDLQKGVIFPDKSNPDHYLVEFRKETVYEPIGSAVLIEYQGFYFVVTADHVVPDKKNVYFRIPRKNNQNPFHRSLLDVSNLTGIGWIRSKQDDLALTLMVLDSSTDDIKVFNLQNGAATYGQVSVGDDVIAIGYPSSVVLPSDPAVHFARNGMIASKRGNGRILIDAILFPGNSGGPVFWKSTMGLTFEGGLTGPAILGRQSRLIGIASQILTYREEALSRQTGRPRVVFEEHSGLSEIISSSRILDLLWHPDVVSAVKKYKEQSKPK